MPLRFLLVVLIIPFLNSYSQEYKLQGKIVDANNTGVAYANILLLKTSDSTLVSGTYTEEDGSFIFEKLQKDSYKLNISYLGYAEMTTNVNVDSDVDMGSLKMEEITENLNEVSIVVKRPTMIRQADRLTFNVASTALIEGSMLQVLQNTPSLVVMDGDIKIKNSSADVYINNRKINLSSTELMELLESSPANSITSIEVITNPPASYDASSGQVINILMGRNLNAVYSGNVLTKYTQGVFPRYNASTSHFFKGEKNNFNLTYSYNNDKINRDNADVVNFLDNSNEIDEIWESDINRTTNKETHTLNFNYDTFFDDRNTLSLSSTALYLPYFKYRIKNNTEITDENGEFLSSYFSNNLTRDDKFNLGVDLDYVHQFKKKGKISFNSHFTLYNYERFQVVNSDFFDSNKMYEASSLFNTNSNQDTQIFTSKVDYSLPIDESTQFETGLKFSNVNSESAIVRRDIVEGEEFINRQNTNAFDYNEKIYAAYVNFSKKWSKWDLNIGVRPELTDIIGISDAQNGINKQDYLKWFPNVSLLHNITENFSLYANYSKSIERPKYTLLNPFKFFLNENIIVSGNPRLQPVIIDYGEIGMTLFDDFNVMAYYKRSKDYIYQLPLQNNETNIIDYSPVNIDQSTDFGIDFSVNKSISDNWYLSFVTSFFNQKDEYTFTDQLVTIEQWSNLSQMVNSFTFLKDNSLSVNLNLLYISKSIFILSEVDPRLLSNLSISKSILKGKAAFSLTAGDLFNTQDPRAVTKYLNQSSVYDTDIDDRYVSLGFRYKFGNTKLKTNERTISNEEIDRLEKDK